MSLAHRGIRFILDISECEKLPSFVGDEVLIVVRSGKNLMQLDVVEDEMPVEFVQKMRSTLAKKREEQGIHYADDMPVGMNLYNLPLGAKLVRVA